MSVYTPSDFRPTLRVHAPILGRPPRQVIHCRSETGCCHLSADTAVGDGRGVQRRGERSFPS